MKTSIITELEVIMSFAGVLFYSMFALAVVGGLLLLLTWWAQPLEQGGPPPDRVLYAPRTWWGAIKVLPVVIVGFQILVGLAFAFAASGAAFVFFAHRHAPLIEEVVLAAWVALGGSVDDAVRLWNAVSDIVRRVAFRQCDGRERALSRAFMLAVVLVVHMRGRWTWRAALLCVVATAVFSADVEFFDPHFKEVNHNATLIVWLAMVVSLLFDARAARASIAGLLHWVGLVRVARLLPPLEYARRARADVLAEYARTGGQWPGRALSSHLPLAATLTPRLRVITYNALNPKWLVHLAAPGHVLEHHGVRGMDPEKRITAIVVGVLNRMQTDDPQPIVCLQEVSDRMRNVIGDLLPSGFGASFSACGRDNWNAVLYGPNWRLVQREVIPNTLTNDTEVVAHWFTRGEGHFAPEFRLISAHAAIGAADQWAALLKNYVRAEQPVVVAGTLNTTVHPIAGRAGAQAADDGPKHVAAYTGDGFDAFAGLGAVFALGEALVTGVGAPQNRAEGPCRFDAMDAIMVFNHEYLN